MDAGGDELLCNASASLLRPVVRVVDHHLTLRVEELPDELLAAV